MREDERLRDVEQRIDAALRSYAHPGAVPEPQIAFAQVTQRALAWGASWRGSWKRMLIVPVGLSVAVVLVAVFWMLRMPRRPEIAWAPKAPAALRSSRQAQEPEASRQIFGKANTASSTEERGQRQLVPGRDRTDRAIGAPEASPRLDVFPTPRPLTPEERALVEFATRTPRPLQDQVLEAERHVGDPIVIAALKIRPLDADDNPDSKQER